jgi:hypothetical protein
MDGDIEKIRAHPALRAGPGYPLVLETGVLQSKTPKITAQAVIPLVSLARHYSLVSKRRRNHRKAESTRRFAVE